MLCFELKDQTLVTLEGPIRRGRDECAASRASNSATLLAHRYEIIAMQSVLTSVIRQRVTFCRRYCTIRDHLDYL